MDYRQYQDIQSAVVRGRDRQGSLLPIDGWPLPLVAEIKTACPGFLLHAFRAQAKWRQSVFLFFAIMGLDRADEFLLRASGSALDQPWSNVLRELGQSLMAMGPKDIVAASVGDIPTGLHGALAKLGVGPMPSPTHYQMLLQLLLGDDLITRQRAKVLLQLHRLAADTLEVVLLVDPVGLIPDLIPRLGSMDRVHRLNAAIKALRSVAGASDKALRQSLEHRATAFRLHEFVNSWLPKVSALPPSCTALEAHPDFQRVVPVTAAMVGSRFSNCLSTKVHDLITGVWSAWVWSPGDLIVVLTEVEQGFVLSGVFGHDNYPPSDEYASRVREVLAEAGVICLTRAPVPDTVKPLLMRRWDNFELDELEFA